LLELEFLRLDGTTVWIEIAGQPIVYEGKSGALVFVRDVTARKLSEQEREKLQNQLTQAQKMESVGRLAGGVAHDFNNMLGAILGYTEMALKRVEPDEPLHTDLMNIQAAAHRSAELTRQLLAFARKQTVSPKVIDLNNTIENMLKLLRRLIGEDIDLVWQPGKEVSPVRMDPAQIDQILANLCVNARDAITGAGKVAIETGNTIFDKDYCRDHAGFMAGEYAMLVVSDNGCGMDKETQSHLFEPFFTTKEVGKGTGLGLATVYGIIKQNHGFINVYSEPGQGTTLKIYLPRYAVKSDQAENEEASKPDATGGETILLVEDEPMILKMTVAMLELLGYTVLPAATPDEALWLAEEHGGTIDLLITDVVMPEMNGLELAEKLASLCPDLKRLFMSGYTANIIAHHGVLDKGVHFLQKPFLSKQLATKVREALAAGESSRTAG
jgi:signal transduction histidine kinase/ActR/RegA family two-component response regulator